MTVERVLTIGCQATMESGGDDDALIRNEVCSFRGWSVSWWHGQV